MQVDETVRRVKPDAFRGDRVRENIIKGALFGIFNDRAEVERIFAIVKAQREY